MDAPPAVPGPEGDGDEPGDRFWSRTWCGVFGMVFGACVGLILTSHVAGVLVGAVVCGLVGYAFGLEVLGLFPWV